MDNEESDKPLKEFSRITVEVLKELAEKQEKLSADSFFLNLRNRPDVKELLGTRIRTDPSDPDISCRSSHEIRHLKSQIENVSTQKERLLKQLTVLETRARETDHFYQQALVSFVELLRTKENESSHGFMDQFKKLVKEGAEIEQLETAFQQLKNSFLKEGFPDSVKRTGRQKPGFSLFSRWLRSVESYEMEEKAECDTDFLERLKKIFQEIVDEIRMDLNESALRKLSAIEEKFRHVDHLEDLLSIRENLRLLIRENIHRNSEERREAATLIKEIGERLAMMEGHVLSSLTHTRETLQASNDFNAVIENQMEKMKNSVSFSKTLSELRGVVISRLAAIDTAIRNKHEEDNSRMKSVEGKMEILQKSLDQMKEEIVRAQDRSRLLEQEILIDPLTGIYNRRAYDKRINEELQRYLRHGNLFSMLLLDVDHFKRINDRYGHTVGDTCLKEIIKRIRPILRKSDFLARFGGEEFIVFLPETDGKGAVEVAEKLRRVVEDTEFIYKAKVEKITISIGLTEVKPSDRSPDILFNRMDQAMYEAKRAGRNRVEVRLD
ncbi:MAG TPA: diguanylate cyclase [Desulfobacterales bacterium]|nr:diguanylate cyclase [Desulfobacterales bacterium]